MWIGILGASHDHLDYIRRAVELFNRAECQQVIHAGDLMSPIALPAFRKLRCPMQAVFGDNEGNRSGLKAGFGILGTLQDPPLEIVTSDGRRIVVVHQRNEWTFKEHPDPIDLFVFSHTHRPFLKRKNGTLWLNPGETCGWVFGNPTVALYDTEKNEAHIVSLDPPLADIPLSDILSRSPSS